MLAGNLASIGVGAIVSVVTSLIVRPPCMPIVSVLSLRRSDLQWPDDFDFEPTRAINAPAPASAPASPRAPSLGGSVEDEKKRDPADSEVEADVAPISALAAAEEEERELDPVALTKSFRIAAWSSVILVRPLPFPLLPLPTLICVLSSCMLTERLT